MEKEEGSRRQGAGSRRQVHGGRQMEGSRKQGAGGRRQEAGGRHENHEYPVVYLPLSLQCSIALEYCRVYKRQTKKTVKEEEDLSRR
ncbi:hypothetical protein EYF80_022323 [Liparis tanakae]|uniref:Uncharacterized protein n=1 Tax=Liparis tanakae TaxID=230148 RepID=A0A4Z2HP16_9TELE|nr:hypothetical protein EYF80_022323 [Liparis tanakae]